jgi:hypothetical protein
MKIKTGVVLEIENNKAVVLIEGGSFVSVPAQKGWQPGHVVSVKYNSFQMDRYIQLPSVFFSHS